MFDGDEKFWSSCRRMFHQKRCPMLEFLPKCISYPAKSRPISVRIHTFSTDNAQFHTSWPIFSLKICFLSNGKVQLYDCHDFYMIHLPEFLCGNLTFPLIFLLNPYPLPEKKHPYTQHIPVYSKMGVHPPPGDEILIRKDQRFLLVN